jgi:ABC-2 type transport system ATP-binding protein
VVAEVEAFTNLNDIRHKMLVALSKGMKQRVSLARALLHDPPVLVMDEPAAALDPRARVELRELLRVLAGRGKAILISSHILTELAEICTAAVIIEQGRVLSAGTIAELVASSAPHRTVIIRALDRRDELYRELLEMPRIERVNRAGDEIAADINGDERVCAGVLAALIGRGYPIAEFKQQRANLEEVFMTVTKGVVQ